MNELHAALRVVGALALVGVPTVMFLRCVWRFVAFGVARSEGAMRAEATVAEARAAFLSSLLHCVVTFVAMFAIFKLWAALAT